MDHERRDQMDKIIQAALDLEPASRGAFVERACGEDKVLHGEIKSALVNLEEAETFLQKSACAEAPGLISSEKTGTLAGAQLGPYKVVSQLGAGGMGEVYLAQDTRLGRQVALKLLPPRFTEDADRVSRFRKEARAASSLNHPNILTIYEVGEVEGMHFMATEFINGHTLTTIIYEKEGLREVIGYLIQVAEGLAKAHAAGIIHRDLKPDNIMVTEDGYAKILDFGLAKLTEPVGELGNDATEAATALMEGTKAGVIMGTASYMSPEQAQGGGVDQRSDVFSFGSILYEAVTLRKPFMGDSFIDTLHRVIYSPPPPVKDFNPLCPDRLEAVVSRCLEKRPEKRYQDVRELISALKGVLTEEDGTPVLDRRASRRTAERINDPMTAEPRPGDSNVTPSPLTFSTSDEVARSQRSRSDRVSTLAAIIGFLVLAGLSIDFLYSGTFRKIKLEYILISLFLGVVGAALCYLIAAMRRSPDALKKKPGRLRSFTVGLGGEDVVKVVVQFAQQSGYKINDIAADRIIMSDSTTFYSWGFFYPVYLSEAAGGGTLVEVGIKSKVFQTGPIVTNKHEDCFNGIRAALISRL